MKHSIKLFFCLLIALFVGMSSVASAEDISNEDLGFEFWAPDGWEQNAEEDSFMMGTDDGLAVIFMDVDAEDLEAAIEGLSEAIDDDIKITKEGEPEEIDLNGISAVVVESEGTIEGEPVEITAVIMITPTGAKKNKATIIFAMGTKEAIKTHEKSLEKFVSSIKPM